MRRVIGACAWMPVLLAVSIAAAQSRPAAEYPNTVIEVRVEGNKNLTPAAVLADVKTRPGQPYTEAVVRDDEQRLLKTRRYDNVVATKTQTDKGVIVTFRVAERPVLTNVAFAGNKVFKDKDIQGIIPFSTGDPIDAYQVDSAARGIEAKYHSKGYHFVQVTYDKTALTEKGDLSYQIVEGPRILLREIRFQGGHSFPDARLLNAVQTRTRFWPFRSGEVDTEQIDRDVVDLTTFYRDKGFLDVEVDRKLDFQPEAKRAVLTFVINEGPRYRVRGIRYEGNKVYSDQQLSPQLMLQAGDFYDGEKLRHDVQKIRDLYGEIGFVNVDAQSRIRYADEPALVDVVYAVSEGGQFRVGRIEIRGNTVTKQNVIRRQLRFYPLGLYDTVGVEESRKSLMESGLFENVTITPYGDEPASRNAVVEVTETQTGKFLIGAGISSNIGLLGQISYTETNFDISAWPWSKDNPPGRPFRGAGQYFSVVAEPGTEQSQFRIDWREPYLMDQPYTLGLRAYYFTANREDWDESRIGAMESIGHTFENRWYAEVANRTENVQINNFNADTPQDARDVEGNNFLDGVQFTLVRDNTDSRWLPAKGDRLALSYEEVIGGFTFGRPEIDYRRYYTLYTDALERKHILAFRGMTGTIVAGEAPLFERYYGGGLGNVRGFKFRGISPRQGPNDDPVGGTYTLFLGSEYTFPLISEVLRGVVFLDSGTVEDKIGVSQYRVSTGVGIRLTIKAMGPMPMSLDFGIPMLKQSEDDTQLISFSVGWVF